MNYNGALEYLAALGRFGSVLGLERIQGLLAELEHPESKIKTIHVTGTNGKGSVTEFLSNMLSAAGISVGTFTSPHFVKYNERITLNGQDISDEVFAQLATEVAAAEEAFKAKGGTQPTQFEVLTAMGFLFFAQAGVDYAVIEVGMGGLWDSTNVIIPEVAVITNVTLEHTNVLGKTVAAIAEQKAGIIKSGVPVVTAATDEALSVIRAKAEQENAPLFAYGKEFVAEPLDFTRYGQSFKFTFQQETTEYAIKLLGDHQIANGAVALMAAKLLATKEPRLTDEAMVQGMARTTWPGRLELLATEPTILLDGAHNPSGVTVLRKALDKYFPQGRRFFVFGMMADKDMAQVAAILFRPEDKIFTVLADDGPRAARPEDLAAIIGSRAIACFDVLGAYQQALQSATPQDVVCVCGSLYLIGTFKAARQAVKQ